MLVGLTSAEPIATRLTGSQPAAVGAPASLAAWMTCFGPSSICVVRSTKAVLIESAVALRSVTGPYWWLNSLRIGFESPFGVNVSPLKTDFSEKPLRSPATVAKVLKVDAAGRSVVAQLRLLAT